MYYMGIICSIFNNSQYIENRSLKIQNNILKEQNKMLKELINRYEMNEDLLLVRWGVVDSYYKKEISQYQHKMKIIVENMLECQTIINNIKKNE